MTPSVLEEMYEAGEMALEECKSAGCTERETVAAVYAAMQYMRELEEARSRAALIH